MTECPIEEQFKRVRYVTPRERKRFVFLQLHFDHESQMWHASFSAASGGILGKGKTAQLAIAKAADNWAAKHGV